MGSFLFHKNEDDENPRRGFDKRAESEANTGAFGITAIGRNPKGN